MTENLNKLIEIPKLDWIKLRDLYLKNWPNNFVGYYTLDNYINWLKFDENIKNLTIYSLNGNWNDGTFIIVDRYQLFLNSLNDNNDRLKIALSLLDWRNGFKVSTFLERHRSAVVDVVESKQLKKEYDSCTPIYYMPVCEAKNVIVDCPDDIVLKNLTEEDAIIANEVWPNQHEGSEFFLKRLGKWNPNIGAYTKNENELVAWCFRLQAGPLGALQTKSTHFRKGLGSLVTKAITKKLADMDHDVFACTTSNNSASQNMFKKLGFKKVDNAFWLRTYPTVDDFHWTDE